MMSIGFTIDELLAKARDAAPALAREQKVMERANTALRLARTDYYPDFTVNGGYYYMGSMPPMYMFRADIKLPLRRAKTRAEITERSEEIAQARHTYEAAARDLEFRIQDEYTAAKTAQTLLDLYARTVIPQARLAVESSLASYETGATDFLTVLSNHVAAFEYEMNYHEQMQEYHLALARLEELTGVELIK
jgi:outer membrane protein TolC